MLSGACLAVMSRATLARNKFVPTPAVAQMPVSWKTAVISVRANARASMP